MASTSTSTSTTDSSSSSTISSFDPIQYKINTKINWNTVAPIYHKDWASTYTGPFKSTNELVKAADINSNDIILDLACGTGAVSNEVVKIMSNNNGCDYTSNNGVLIGIDISRVALLIANSYIPSSFSKSMLIEMDAENLGIRKSSFNKILCQFGMMFFPNALSVLRQLKDILIKDGRMVIAVHGTSEGVPYFSSIMDSVLKYIPNIRPKGTPSVHVFGNPDDLYSVLDNTGFSNILIKKHTFHYRAGTFDEYWSDYMSSTANSIRPIIESKDSHILSVIKEDSKARTDKFTDSQGIINFPWDVLIATSYNY